MNLGLRIGLLAKDLQSRHEILGKNMNRAPFVCSWCDACCLLITQIGSGAAPAAAQIGDEAMSSRLSRPWHSIAGLSRKHHTRKLPFTINTVPTHLTIRARLPQRAAHSTSSGRWYEVLGSIPTCEKLCPPAMISSRANCLSWACTSYARWLFCITRAISTRQMRLVLLLGPFELPRNASYGADLVPLRGGTQAVWTNAQTKGQAGQELETPPGTRSSV